MAPFVHQRFLGHFVTKDLGSTASGSDDEQVDGCCKVPPLVALYAGDPNLLTMVEQAVRVTQNTDTAVAFACGFAQILENLMLGKAASVQEACELARAALKQQVSTTKDGDVFDALGLVEELSSVPCEGVGEKIQAALQFQNLSKALS